MLSPKLFLVYILLISPFFSSRILDQIEDDSEFQGICSSYIGIVEGYKCIRDFNIGRSKRSSVFLVKNLKEEIFAMKVQQKSAKSQHESDMYDKLEGEPYIAKKETEGFYEDIHVIIMEYGERKSLEIVLQTSNHFDNIFKILEFFKKIMIGILAIHEKNYIHSKLSLGHIVVTNDYNPLFINFSSMKKINQEDYATGIPVYMSPKLVLAMNKGEKLIYTPSIDVFAAGIILYYMQMKKFPFGDYSMNYNLFVRKPLYFKEHSSILFMNVILKCLQKDDQIESLENIINYLETNANENHELELLNTYFYILNEKELKIVTNQESKFQNGGTIILVIGVLLFSFFIIFCFCQVCFFFVWSRTSDKNMSARPSEMDIDTTFIDSLNVSRLGAFKKDQSKE